MSSYDEARHAAAEAVHRELYDGTDGLYGNATFVANAAIDAFLAKLSADSEMVERVAKAIGARHEAGYTLGALYSENMRELARAAIAAMLAQEVKG